MKYAIDETELARLEELAGKASKGPFFEDGFDVQDDDDNEVACCNRSDDLSEDVQEANTHYIAAACNSVPALVAEVRRLRRNYECSEKSLQRHEHMVAELMEKVEAWEWWEEVRTYDPWSEHPYCTACGNRSKRGKIFDCAVDEYEKIKSTAREAVHADRE